MIHARRASHRRLAVLHALAIAVLLSCGGAANAGSCRDKCAAEEKTCEKHPLSKRQLEIACKWAHKNCPGPKTDCDAKYLMCGTVQPQGLLHVMDCMTIQIECQGKCPK
jgi:hypothetical protein